MRVGRRGHPDASHFSLAKYEHWFHIIALCCPSLFTSRLIIRLSLCFFNVWISRSLAPSAPLCTFNPQRPLARAFTYSLYRMIHNLCQPQRNHDFHFRHAHTLDNFFKFRIKNTNTKKIEFLTESDKTKLKVLYWKFIAISFKINCGSSSMDVGESSDLSIYCFQRVGWKQAVA